MTYQGKFYTGGRIVSNDICKDILAWRDEVIFTPVFILVALDIKEKYIFDRSSDYCYDSYSSSLKNCIFIVHFILLPLVSLCSTYIMTWFSIAQSHNFFNLLKYGQAVPLHL